MDSLLLVLCVFICGLVGVVVSLWLKVRLLEGALKHLTPDHRADGLERRVQHLEVSSREVGTALGSLTRGLATTYGRVEQVKTYADETFFRKDNAV
jgi:hypothetical protein